jgi:3-hydroxyisobutyrate dehydrogenase-like beta-hydroxyacid dehydrogenase
MRPPDWLSRARQGDAVGETILRKAPMRSKLQRRFAIETGGSTVTAKTRIGFIGVGLMGHGMAKNIVEKGYPLTILGHRNRKPVEDLIGRGAREARSAADLARQSDIVFLCVTGSPQVESIVFGKDGLLEGMSQGKIVADCSTAEPTSTLMVAEAIQARGGRMVDTPLVRTPKEAEEGRLGVMTGGDAATLEEIQPVLKTFAEIIVHAGPLGAAHKLKLIHNFLALATAASVAEAIVAAMKSGVDLKAFTEIATSGGADSVMLRRFAKYYLEGDDSMAKFAITNATKDMRYYTHLAEATPVVHFIGEAVHQLYALADMHGFGEKYIPRLVDALAQLNRAKP